MAENEVTIKTPAICNQENATTAKILEASLRQLTHWKYSNHTKQ